MNDVNVVIQSAMLHWHNGEEQLARHAFEDLYGNIESLNFQTLQLMASFYHAQNIIGSMPFPGS